MLNECSNKDTGDSAYKLPGEEMDVEWTFDDDRVCNECMENKCVCTPDWDLMERLKDERKTKPSIKSLVTLKGVSLDLIGFKKFFGKDARYKKHNEEHDSQIKKIDRNIKNGLKECLDMYIDKEEISKSIETYGINEDKFHEEENVPKVEVINKETNNEVKNISFTPEDKMDCGTIYNSFKNQQEPMSLTKNSPVDDESKDLVLNCDDNAKNDGESVKITDVKDKLPPHSIYGYTFYYSNKDFDCPEHIYSRLLDLERYDKIKREEFIDKSTDEKKIVLFTRSIRSGIYKICSSVKSHVTSREKKGSCQVEIKRKGDVEFNSSGKSISQGVLSDGYSCDSKLVGVFDWEGINKRKHNHNRNVQFNTIHSSSYDFYGDIDMSTMSSPGPSDDLCSYSSFRSLDEGLCIKNKERYSNMCQGDDSDYSPPLRAIDRLRMFLYPKDKKRLEKIRRKEFKRFVKERNKHMERMEEELIEDMRLFDIKDPIPKTKMKELYFTSKSIRDENLVKYRFKPDKSAGNGYRVWHYSIHKYSFTAKYIAYGILKSDNEEISVPKLVIYFSVKKPRKKICINYYDLHILSRYILLNLDPRLVDVQSMIVNFEEKIEKKKNRDNLGDHQDEKKAELQKSSPLSSEDLHSSFNDLCIGDLGMADDRTKIEMKRMVELVKENKKERGGTTTSSSEKTAIPKHNVSICDYSDVNLYKEVSKNSCESISGFPSISNKTNSRECMSNAVDDKPEECNKDGFKKLTVDDIQMFLQGNTRDEFHNLSKPHLPNSSKKTGEYPVTQTKHLNMFSYKPLIPNRIEFSSISENSLTKKKKIHHDEYNKMSNDNRQDKAQDYVSPSGQFSRHPRYTPTCDDNSKRNAISNHDITRISHIPPPRNFHNQQGLARDTCDSYFIGHPSINPFDRIPGHNEHSNPQCSGSIHQSMNLDNHGRMKSYDGLKQELRNFKPYVNTYKPLGSIKSMKTLNISHNNGLDKYKSFIDRDVKKDILESRQSPESIVKRQKKRGLSLQKSHTDHKDALSDLKTFINAAKQSK